MAKPTLEGLPSELLILILHEIPDLASLKSIVLSSPICHQAYLIVRHETLCRIIKNQWGVLLGDAIAATRSRGLYFKTYKHEAIALLDTWRRKEEINNLASGSSNRIDQPGSLEEVFHLFYLHRVFHFFLEDYATNTKRLPWIENDEWETSILPIELSHTEKHRLLRALCRLQTYENIFGSNEVHPGELWTGNRNCWHLERSTGPAGSVALEGSRLFFMTIPPWEYHEMGCVWAHLMTKVEPIYKEVAAGLRDLLDKHMSKDNWQSQFFEFLPHDVRPALGVIESLPELEGIKQWSRSLAAMGPDFVYRLMHETPLIQRDMVMLNANELWDDFPGTFLVCEDNLSFLYPADRHAVKDYEYLWSTLPTLEKPNLAWKKMFLLPDRSEETFERAFCLEGDHEPVWYLGLSIFDDERLIAWEAPLSEYYLGEVPESAA